MNLQTFDKVLHNAIKKGQITIEKSMITNIEGTIFKL